MTAKVSRRRLALLAATPLAQTAPAQQATVDESLAMQRASQKRAIEALAKVDLPMSVEPAFLFKP